MSATWRRPFRWLMLAGLEIDDDATARWETRQPQLLDFLRARVRECGPPEVIVLAGQLTQKATPAEFSMLDVFIERARVVLSELCPRAPVWIATPGPSDLVAPTEEARQRLATLGDLCRGESSDDVALYRDFLWRRRDTGHIDQLFRSYIDWFRRTIASQGDQAGVTIRESFFPGDFELALERRDSFPVRLVVHNTAWSTWTPTPDGVLLPQPQVDALRRDADPTAPGQQLTLTYHARGELDAEAQRALDSLLQPAAAGERSARAHLHASAQRCQNPRCTHASSFGCDGDEIAAGMLTHDGFVIREHEQHLDLDRGAAELVAHARRSSSGSQHRGAPVVFVEPLLELQEPHEHPDASGTRRTVAETLAQHRHILIFGDVGAGKSTLVHRLALALAETSRANAARSGSESAGGLLDKSLRGERTIPVLLYADELACALPANLASIDLVWLAEYLVGRGHPGVAPSRVWQRERWIARMERGELAVLIDGLDELAESDRPSVLALVSALVRKATRCRCVLTSYPRLDEPALDSFQIVQLTPFTDAQISRYIERWMDQVDGADDRARALTTAILKNSELRRLAQRPAGLACLCASYGEHEELPCQRARVLATYARCLLNAKQTQRAELHKLSVNSALTLLAQVAFVYKQGHTEHLDLEFAADAVRSAMENGVPRPAKFDARDWLEFESTRSGILEPADDDLLRFRAPFLDFFAARWLASRRGHDAKVAGPGASGAVSFKDWWTLLRPQLADPTWRDVLLLFAGCLLEDAAGSNRLTLLLERLFTLYQEAVQDATNPAREAVLYAQLHALLEAVDSEDYKLPKQLEPRRERAERAMTELLADGSLDTLERRLEMKLAIGPFSEPRVDLEEPLDRLSSLPTTRGVKLGEFPTTVTQFAQFVRDDGYADRDLWDAEGWTWRQTHGWSEPGRWKDQLEFPNRPVVYVSCYEARAYCRWLSQRTERYTVRLPTTAEWSEAAPSGHINFSVTQINAGLRFGAPTPVGLLGDGATARPRSGRRFSDMLGNVWEWCVDADPQRVAVMGGCWRTELNRLSSTLQVPASPAYRNECYGFRVAVVERSSCPARVELSDHVVDRESPVSFDWKFSNFLPSSLGAVNPLAQRIAFDKALAAMTRCPPLGETTLGKFLIEDRLGSGGMGTVYRAWDTDLNRKVAIKVLHEGLVGRDPGEQLLSEARALARVKDKNAVMVHTFERAEGFSYIVMEYIDGPTLDNWCQEVKSDPSSGEPRWRQILERCIEAGRGIAAVHSSEFIHGDFKPTNVLVSKHDGAKIVDFGLRSIFDSQDGSEAPRSGRAHERVAVGTARYMAPEQARCLPADARSDQYAFCLTLCELLYGYPFEDEGRDREALVKRGARWSVTLPEPGDDGPPNWLRRVIEQGLSDDPACRFESMQELLARLSEPEADEPSPPLNPRVYIIGAVGLLLTISFTLSLIWRQHIDAGQLADVSTGDTGAIEDRPPAEKDPK